MIQRPSQIKGFPNQIEPKMWGVYAPGLVFVSLSHAAAEQVAEGFRKTYFTRTVISEVKAPLSTWGAGNPWPSTMTVPVMGRAGFRKLMWGWSSPELAGHIMWGLKNLGLKSKGKTVTFQ